MKLPLIIKKTIKNIVNNFKKIFLFDNKVTIKIIIIGTNVKSLVTAASPKNMPAKLGLFLFHKK